MPSLGKWGTRLVEILAPKIEAQAATAPCLERWVKCFCRGGTLYATYMNSCYPTPQVCRPHGRC